MSYKIEKNKHSPLESLLLEIYLSNRCNMNCSYCASRHMIHEKEAKKLTFDQLKQAVDVISSDKYIQDKFNGQVGISFTGDEPLLEFELLKKIIGYIRKKKEKFQLRVDTNAVLLDMGKVDFLLDNDVRIFISLDGCKKAHDLHRVFWVKRKSSFDVILNNIKKIPFQKRCGNNFCISATLTSETIKFLPETMEFFKHLGFSVIVLCLETYEIWRMNRLRNALRSFKSRLRTTLEHKMDINNIEFVFRKFLFGRCEGPDREIRKAITLFHDGYFYPCDFVVKPPLEKKI